ncbi:MAG: hypothetical protein R2747_18895 [Pyrinomonadaceae bacterium]
MAKAQEAEAKLSDGTYGFYNLLAEDLGETCKAEKPYSGTVSKLEAGESDGTTIYSFLLTPAKGKKITIGLILTDSEIPPAKVGRFLTDGRKVKVIARNCDGQLTAVEIVSVLPMESEP